MLRPSMDAFSYLSVLISIVIGLAITQLLQGYRTILIARARVRFFGAPLGWAALLLILSVQMWWSMFGLSQHGQWSFLQFTMVLLQVVLLYMLTALVFPDVGSDQRVDLREHYFSQAPWFFGFGMSLLIVSVVKDLIVTGLWPGRTNLAFHALFFTAWAFAAVTKWEPYHRVLPWLMTLVFSLYILLLFAKL
jgi:hypothetical protein